MSRDIALDTSVLIPYLKNDSAINEKLVEIDAISIPIFVIGEMMVGFSYTAFPDSLRVEFESFLSHANILDCSRSVADKYGKIFA